VRCEWGGIIAGGGSVTTHGTWYEPLKGRGLSHEETKGEREVFGKAGSRRDSREIVSNGKRV